MITSLQNSAIKNVVKLSKSKDRLEQQLFLIEGARELSLALEGDYEVAEVFVCGELFSTSRYPKVLEPISNSKIVEISREVFHKIAYRDNSDGIVVLARPKRHGLDDLTLSRESDPNINPFLVLLESVEKPGNLGAVLRTADAAGVDAVLVCDPRTDLYNPNVIRSSVGTLFTVQTALCTSSEALEWLREYNIASFAAELEAAEYYQNIDFTGPSAIVMGTEAEGLTDFWLANATKRIKIPMRGKIDSLNVSVSTAILTFEAMRQRGF